MRSPDSLLRSYFIAHEHQCAQKSLQITGMPQCPPGDAYNRLARLGDLALLVKDFTPEERDVMAVRCLGREGYQRLLKWKTRAEMESEDVPTGEKNEKHPELLMVEVKRPRAPSYKSIGECLSMDPKAVSKAAQSARQKVRAQMERQEESDDS